jgi:LEA14-like dessication related protein
MERYKITESHAPRHSAKQGIWFPFLLLTAIFCISCGPQVIKGRSPFISISGMSLTESKLSADFDIRNQNGIPMTIDMIDITVTVNDVDFVRENRSFDMIIGANSAEQVHVEELPDEGRQALLESLEKGEVKSLPFDLKGRVHTVEDGYLTFEQKGYLYPVPGRPGDFRATVTQAQGLQREEKF